MAKQIYDETNTSSSIIGRAKFRLSRLQEPEPENDPALILLPDIDPKTGKERCGFECEVKVRREAKRRAKSLELNGSNHALELAEALKRTVAPDDFRSFASPIYTGEFRRRFLGEAIRLVRTHLGEIWFYTLVSGKWRIPADELAYFRATKLLQSLRVQLIKSGDIGMRGGWMITTFHNEYDPTDDTYQPHFHVIACGEKRDALEAMRGLKMFAGGKKKMVYRPIQRDKIIDVPRQVSYLFKGFWPAKSSSASPPGYQQRRSSRTTRIPEPRHAESLLFLDQQRFSDLIWLHGLAIKDGRLVPSRKP